jgi:hypothetical protein
MMNKPTIREDEKRVTIAFGLMAVVLTLLGTQHLSMGSGDPASRPITSAFAAASAPSR